jgi:hypothetical protein
MVRGGRRCSPAGLLVPPAALWVYPICFYLWPWWGEETGRRQVTGASEPGMSVPVNAACAALSVASAAAVTFIFNLPHPNWAVWSALTVIRPARAVSLRRSVERVGGRGNRLHTGPCGNPGAGRQAVTARGDHRGGGNVHGGVRTVYGSGCDSERPRSTCRLRPARRRPRCRPSALLLHSHRRGHRDRVHACPKQRPGR